MGIRYQQGLNGMLNLDTHIVIDFLKGQLSEPELRILETDTPCISDIVIWEMAKLNSLGRITLNLQHPEILRFLSSIRIFPIDALVAEKSTELDFKSDPADEIIAATSLVYNIPLLTRDKKIRRSRLVKCV